GGVVERNPTSPIRSPTPTAPPKATAIRKSEAPVCVQISPLRSTSTRPLTTDQGDGRTYAPYFQDNPVQMTTASANTTSVARWRRSVRRQRSRSIEQFLPDALGIVP